MELVTVRRIVAALLLSFPFMTAGEGEALAGGDATEQAVGTRRGAWSVREVRVWESDRLRRVYSLNKPRAKKRELKMGFSAFSRVGEGRRVSVLSYTTPLSLGPSDFILKMRAPGGRGSLMRVELEF